MKKQLKSKLLLIFLAIVFIISCSIMYWIRFNPKIKALPNEIKRATSYNLVTNDDIENCKYVKFNAFFAKDTDNDGYAEKYDGTCNQIKDEPLLYFDINVLTDGKLEDGKITIDGKNFILSTSLVRDNVIKKDYIGSNITEIELNTVNAGTQKTFSGSIYSLIRSNINNYSAEDNKVIFTGRWVSSDGKTTIPIRKQINLKTDWYGYTETEASKVETNHYITELINNKDNNDKNKFVFSIGYKEIKNELIIEKEVTEVTIPKFNEYNPKSVAVRSKDCDWNYDDSTQKLTITRNAEVDNNGNIKKLVSNQNDYEIEVEYEQEAFDGLNSNSDVSLTFETMGYYYCFNNKSDEISNEIESMSSARYDFTHIWRNVILPDTVISPEVSVNVGNEIINKDNNTKYYCISKDPVIKRYNNVIIENYKDTYTVEWKIYTGGNIEKQDGIFMQQVKDDHFYNNSGNLTSMKDYSRVLGVYFENCYNTLGADGWIKLYDNETNELLNTFTSKDWNNYSKSSFYELDEKVKSIRIETSKANENKTFYVYQVKEINDEKIVKDFSLENFKNLTFIKSYSNIGLKVLNGEDVINETTELEEEAYYEAPVSRVDLEVNPSTIYTQQTVPVEIRLYNNYSYNNESEWKDGEFVIEIPEEILKIEIDDVICNDTDFKNSSYETFESNGKNYIKIFTKNENPVSNFDIRIKANVIADSRSSTTQKNINLYAINEYCHNYRATSRIKDTLDINENGNVDEYVAFKSINLKVLAPSSLLTAQTLSDFDDSGKSVVSPLTAILDKSTEARDAKINVSITNNYINTVSETKIVGKIPYEGNKYQLNDEIELGSTYSVTMKKSGIELPDKVKDKAKVYYSDKEKVTEDLSDTQNNWKTKENITNWSEIKSYLIDLGDYIIPVNEILTFSYDIVIPGNLNYNDVTYSTHAVYFCLDTKDGKLESKTEVNKLGIMIAKKYNLELKKYKKGANKLVSGATYKVTDGEESKTATTKNGNARLKELYVDREYTLKEINSPGNYALNEEEVKFKVTVNDKGEPQINVISGSFRGEPTFTNSDNGFSLNLNVEDIAKYDVILTKTDSVSKEKIKDIRFKVSGGVYGTAGRVFTTDNIGQISVLNLELDTEYTIQETKANGYYKIDEPIKFKLIKNGEGKIVVETTSNQLSKSNVEENEDEDKPIFNINIENTPIPTYSLNIKKKNDKGEVLKGAQFKLTNLDTNEEETATTDDKGEIKFETLYQYVEGKNLTGQYKLQEIMATEGYATNRTEIKFKVESNKDGLKLLILEGEEAVESSSSDSNSITFNIVNKPIFKLTKKGDNDKLLPGAKFRITGEIEEESESQDINMKNVGFYEKNNEKISCWTQNEDGTWIGTRSDNDDEVTLESEEFEITDKATLTFDYAAFYTNHNINSFYYTITKIDAEDARSGLANILGKRNDTCIWIGSDSINDLDYKSVNIDLSKGKYKLEFRFGSHSETSEEEYGYVKNVKLLGVKSKTIIKDEEYTTDENGEITANLPAGLYKIEEIEAPQGYLLPEKKEDRIHNVGIDESKSEEKGIGMRDVNVNTISGDLSINATKATSDGGYIIAGSYNGEIELKLKNATKEKLTSKGESDAIIIKFDENDNIQWYYNDGDTGYDELKDIDICSNGYIAVGYKTTDKQEDGWIIKLDSSGNKAFEKVLVGEAKDIIRSVKVLSTEDFVVAGTSTGRGLYINKLVVDENIEIELKHDMFLVCYKSDGSYYWNNTENLKNVMTGSFADDWIGVEECSFGVIVAYNVEAQYPVFIDTAVSIFSLDGNYEMEDSFGFSGLERYYHATGIKCDSEGNFILTYNTNMEKSGYAGIKKGHIVSVPKPWNPNEVYYKCSSIYSSEWENCIVKDLKVTSDGGMLLGGYFNGDLDANNDNLREYKSNETDGILIKLDSGGKIEWTRNLSGAKDEKVQGVVQLKNGDFLEVSNFDSTAIYSESDDELASSDGSQTSFIIRYGEVVTSPEIPEAQEITVKNEIRQYEITTEILENSKGERAGGTITGENIEGSNKKLVEKVKYGYDSSQEIVITPDKSYDVYKIKINGKDYKFVADEKGIVKIPVFKKVTEDMHITVVFEKDLSTVLIHHYYENTEQKIADDEQIKGKMNDDYETEPTERIPANYVCVNKTPENYKGKIIKDLTEVTYYYIVKKPDIDNKITKISKTNVEKEYKVSPEETKIYPVLTKEDEAVTYDITYNVKINEYIGKADVEIIDTLPAEIDEEKSDLGKGVYDAKTIKWNDELNDINTYSENKAYEKEIKKTIKVVYKGQNLAEDLVNNISGNIKLYYPEDYPTDENKPLAEDKKEDKVTVKQGYTVKLNIEKQWEKDEEKNRPDSITITIKADSEDFQKDYVMKAEEGWKLEIKDLPKYAKNGEKITYKIIENIKDYDCEVSSEETQVEGETVYNYIIKNTYNPINAQMTKEGLKEMTSSAEAIKYKIHFTANAKGNSVVKIVDTLPYKINTKKSDIAKGVYDEENKTITWEEKLSNKTDKEIYPVDLTKEISIVYENVDLTKDKLINEVKGEIELTDINKKDSATASFDTEINVKGKVIVRYLDEKGKQISDDKEITGKVGDDYKTEPQEIEGYEVTKVPENAQGKITEETIIVSYSYKKKENPKTETPVETVKINPDDKKQQTITPSTQHEPVVYTGDNEHIEIYIAIIAISTMYLVSVSVIIIVKKHKKN